MIELPSSRPFVGGPQLDWVAATTSFALLIILFALSFQRILGLDEKLLAVVRDARVKKLVRQQKALEQARQTLEEQFRREE